MTTYHELLGTSEEDSARNIKQRYRLLSARLHPDKGGSKAMMQLLSFAYEKVQSGFGNDSMEMLRVDFASEQHLKSMTIELARLKRELEGLRSENQSLKRDGRKAENNSSNGSEAVERLNRELAQARVELSVLKEHRQKLRTEKDGADKEITRLTQELHRALTNNELLETELTEAGVKNQIGLLHWARKFWFPAFFILFLMAFTSVIISLTTSHLTSNNEFSPDSGAQKSEAQHQKLSEERVSASDDNQKLAKTKSGADAVLVPVPDFSNVDVKYWTLIHDKALEKPYIALSNLEGSVVVLDCDEKFRLYLYEEAKPVKLSANLEFSHEADDYFVYDIRYGNGTNLEQWRQDRAQIILNQRFAGLGFTTTLLELKAFCS
ncbi:hypothetical protein CS022_04040 [Veronia nyctiphanis]|uniref:J domain-containing protein n=1 Tax=Veronia nyctiphanis TaxID=1278244 RepID=A0A4Q0YYS6_9GAMM|nr:J domain-containing protein [Veronia nyctiphanis]RXJ74241.1 hypothetical protein CS022_04040 [Veronia nyctiphanis]